MRRSSDDQTGPRDARPRSPRTDDPQVTVQGRVKANGDHDIIVFSIPLVFFEIVCIVPIPEDGDTMTVFCKFKVNRFRAG